MSPLRKEFFRHSLLIACAAAGIALLGLALNLLLLDRQDDVNRLLPQQQAGQQLHAEIQTLSALAAQIALTVSRGELDTLSHRIEAQWEAILRLLAHLEAAGSPVSAQEALRTQIGTIRRILDAATTSARTHRGDGGIDGEEAFLERNQASALHDAAVKLATHASALSVDLAREVDAQSSRMRQLMFLLVALAATAVILVGFGVRWQYRLIDRRLIGRIEKLSGVMAANAVEDLLDRDAPTSDDELDRMQAEFRSLYYRLRQALDQARELTSELERKRDQLEVNVAERTAELSLAKDAAEAANRAKTTFLANMSHELRTPMNGIIGLTGMARRKATDPKLIDQLTKIDQASQRLLAVINDILDISKIEAERLTLEQNSFTLGEVLENLISLIGHEASDKGLKLSIDMPPEVAGLSLRGDPLRLGQILLNFTANAIKFTEQGAITLRIRPLENTPDTLLLRIEVTDTGIGISAADQQRLFTAFEQADGSMTRKYGGTGLGLAISKQLAKLMGGDVGVSSQPGAGSTFWFTVSLGKIAGAVQPAPTFAKNMAEAQLKASFAGVRILLAEDEPISQEVSCGLLEDAGFAVDLAEDGRQAVEMARQTGYDLILMDMQMPHLNGVDATRVIRTLPGYAQTPILAMTANAFDEDRQICIDAGMNDHIGKPVNPEVLFETLLKWLSKARA
jgi:signal transduction histidine kinase/ActR/RegA family two-component response regulator